MVMVSVSLATARCARLRSSHVRVPASADAVFRVYALHVERRVAVR